MASFDPMEAFYCLHNFRSTLRLCYSRSKDGVRRRDLLLSSLETRLLGTAFYRNQEVLAHVPPGRYILIRSGKNVEAIRFFDIQAALSEGDMCGCASYDVYEVQAARATTQTAAPKHRGQVSEFNLRGFHPFAYQPGHTKLEGTLSGA